MHYLITSLPVCGVTLSHKGNNFYFNIQSFRWASKVNTNAQSMLPIFTYLFVLSNYYYVEFN
jgi:hypothetical protein